jgi:Carboxypeptidase regulatory-like domain
MRLAAIPLIIALATLAAQAQTASRPETIDVALSASGEFVSQCQDVTGQGVAGANIRILNQGREIATATSGADGWFRFEGLQPGSYQLSANHWSNPIRVWAADAAPPVAQDPIVLILQNRSAAQSAPDTAAARPEGSASPATTQAPVAAGPASGERQNAQHPPAGEPEAAEAVTHEVGTAAADAVSTEFAAEPVKEELPRTDLAVLEQSPAQPPLTSEQTASAEAYPLSENGMIHHAAGSSDPVYNPFHDDYPVPPALVQEPAGEELAPLPAQQHAPSGSYPPPLVVESAPAPYCPPECYPPAYPIGPTVGDAILTGVGIGAITVGAVAIYKYDRHNDRRPASP